MISRKSVEKGAETKEDESMVEVSSIGCLPRDLIIEILSRLPVKNLCRLRCVSNQWLHLLSRDRQLIRRHHVQSKRRPLLLSRKYGSGEEEEEEEEGGPGGKHEKAIVELTSIDKEGALVNTFRAPISGPIYTCTSFGPLVVFCCPFRVYICNPSMQKFLPVPLSSSVTRYYMVGFGHLESSKEYKIVHLFFDDLFAGTSMGCEIFTLGDGERVSLGSWRRIRHRPFLVRINGSPICVNEMIYRMVSELTNGLNNKLIISFDLEKEEFGFIHYPRCCLDRDYSSLFLTGFKGSLCLVNYSAAGTAIDLWVLKDNHHKTWLKSNSISLLPLGTEIEVQGLVPWDDEDGEILINTQQKGLVSCNFEDQSFRIIKSQVEERYKKPCYFHEDFFSLHS